MNSQDAFFVSDGLQIGRLRGQLHHERSNLEAWQNHAESLANRYAKLHKDNHETYIYGLAWRQVARNLYKELHGEVAVGLKKLMQTEEARARKENPYNGPDL